MAHAGGDRLQVKRATVSLRSRELSLYRLDGEGHVGPRVTVRDRVYVEPVERGPMLGQGVPVRVHYVR